MILNSSEYYELHSYLWLKQKMKIKKLLTYLEYCRDVFRKISSHILYQIANILGLSTKAKSVWNVGMCVTTWDVIA